MSDFLSKFRNAVLGAAMADQPAMMTASGWRLNEKGDYVLDQQNDPHVILLRDNLAAEGAGVMLGEFGIPAVYGLYNLGLRGLGKAGSNYARAKLISREMKDVATPNHTYPLNVGWGPKQTIKVTHATDSLEPLQLFFDKRYDVTREGANPFGVWYLGKWGLPRTAATNSLPGKAEKAEKARKVFEDRKYKLTGEVTLDKPLTTVGEVPNRSTLSYDAEKMGADGIIYNNVYDNGFDNNLVILSLKLHQSDINYFKDKYGREVTPTPYPGPDSDLANAVLHSLRSVLRDYFSPEKINQIKTTMNWGNLEISELLSEILRTIGNGPDVLIKGPMDGFTDIALHRGLILNSGSEAKGLSTVVLNRERIPDVQMALESGIHEIGVHGKTASLKPENFGKGGRDDMVKEWFPRLAELSLKNKELADLLLQPNRVGRFLGLFLNVGDLEKYFVNKGLSWNKWQKFYDAWKRYKYVTASDETTARAYTGLLFNKVYDPNKKTLNIKLLELYNTPESVEAFKKAVLGVAPVATATSLIPSDKKGSKILIKKKNRGKFTEYCGGEVTDECILKAKKSKNPKLRKRATFAANSRRWSKKQLGGLINYFNNIIGL